MLVNPFVIWRGPGTRTPVRRVASGATRFEVMADLTRAVSGMRPRWYLQRYVLRATSPVSWIRGVGR